MERTNFELHALPMGHANVRVVLVVAEHESRYLLIRETLHGHPWYLPAGRIEPGESVHDGARRETLEEAGIEIALLGLLRFEEHVRPGGGTVQRFVVAARPLTVKPKTSPDEHSLEARWVPREEIAALPLRDPEVIDHVRAHALATGLPAAPYGFGLLR